MDARELRISNFIYRNAGDEDVIVEVSYLSEFRINSMNESFFHPILLTEEWLLSLGFTETILDLGIKTGEFYKGRIGLLWIPGSTEFQLKYGTAITQLTVKYVHKLQNVYYELENKELTRK
jgi:hypothetical protein